MRGGGQNLNELELFDSRRGQEFRSEACSPTGFQVRDTVLSMAHLNAGFIVEVVNQQDGEEPPVAIIADCPGHARVERAGPSRINCEDRKSTRLNSSHDQISYAVFCLKK